MKYPKRLYETHHQGMHISHLVRTISGMVVTPPPELIEPIEPPELIEPIEPPELIEPEITCHSTTNHIWFNIEQRDDDNYTFGDWTTDQRYAIKIGNETFNADHSLSILGQQFELGGRVYSIPYSSGSSAAIYLNDYTDEIPVRIRFIPSPNPEHNTIYSINTGYYAQDAEVEYVNKDTEFTICLKPELTTRVFTCVGATNKLVLKFNAGTSLPDSIYLGIDNKWSMSFDLDTLPIVRYNYSSKYDYKSGIELNSWITASLEGDELTIAIESNELASNYRMSLYSLENEMAAGTMSIVEGHNPTAYYDEQHKNINVCLVPNDVPE